MTWHSLSTGLRPAGHAAVVFFVHAASALGGVALGLAGRHPQLYPNFQVLTSGFPATVPLTHWHTSGRGRLVPAGG